MLIAPLCVANGNRIVDGKAKCTPVKPGASDLTHTLVRKGLEESDAIVIGPYKTLEKLKQRFPKEVAHGVLGYHVRIDEAQARGLSVFEYAPRDRGAKTLAELAEELELRAPLDTGEPT